MSRPDRNRNKSPEPDSIKPPDLRKLKDFDTPSARKWIDSLTCNAWENGNGIEFDVTPCLKRVQDLVTALNRVFVDKKDIIDLMAWCTIAQLPLLMLGHWGTAKSMLVRKMAEGLGIQPKPIHIEEEDEFLEELRKAGDEWREWITEHAGERRHFEYLVTRFTTPEELLGGMNVEVMLGKSVHLRNTRGLLPRAEVAFLDEVFKASPPILNALLAILNERLLHNAGLPWHTNLTMVFAASNEPPPQDQGHDLGAFYDRFPVRVLCDPVKHEEQTIIDLLDRTHKLAFLRLLGTGNLPELKALEIGQEACVNDFRLLEKVCMVRYGSYNLQDGSNNGIEYQKTFVRVLMNLRHEYDVSDRSAGHFFRLARARALLRGATRMEKDDCSVFKYCGKVPEVARRLPDIVGELIR